MSKWNKGGDQMAHINALYADTPQRPPINPIELTVVADGENAIVVNQYGALFDRGPRWAMEIEARRWNGYFTPTKIDSADSRFDSAAKVRV